MFLARNNRQLLNNWRRTLKQFSSIRPSSEQMFLKIWKSALVYFLNVPSPLKLLQMHLTIKMLLKALEIILGSKSHKSCYLNYSFGTSPYEDKINIK